MVFLNILYSILLSGFGYKIYYNSVIYMNVFSYMYLYYIPRHIASPFEQGGLQIQQNGHVTYVIR